MFSAGPAGELQQSRNPAVFALLDNKEKTRDLRLPFLSIRPIVFHRQHLIFPAASRIPTSRPLAT
jgi:hypothetical protein